MQSERYTKLRGRRYAAPLTHDTAVPGEIIRLPLIDDDLDLKRMSAPTLRATGEKGAIVEAAT